MKPKHLIPIAFLSLLITLSVGLAKQDDPVTVSNYRLSGPYTHKNLTVFLIHGKDQTNKTFLTLQEALAQKKVRVYETKDVNELAIRNLSNQDIYVQAGDIVEGTVARVSGDEVHHPSQPLAVHLHQCRNRRPRERPGAVGGCLRPATASDAPVIHALISRYESEGRLLPRPAAEIAAHARPLCGPARTHQRLTDVPV